MNWPVVPLGEVSELVYGKALRGYSDEKNDEHCARVFGTNGPIGWAKAALIERPTVIVGRKGAYRGIHFSETPSWAIDTAFYTKVDLDRVDMKWFYYRLLLVDINGMNSGAAIPSTRREDFYSVKLPLPDLMSQKRIADILSAYDDLIENNRRRMGLLEEAARLLYREWFVHFRFPGHEHVKITDGLPEGWERVRLSDKFDTTSGGTPSRQRPEFFDGEINWVKTQELDEKPIFSTAEKISEEAVRCSSAKLLPAHTLLVSIYGNTNIGRTGILAVPGATNQACVALLPKRKSNDWIFAQQWLQQNREYIVGLAQGAAQTNISQQTLRGLELLWPKDILLDAFLEVALEQYQQIECLCHQNQKLAQARDLLLPRLMNGEIAV